MDELRAAPPHILTAGGHAAVIPFLWGPFKGVHNEIYGDGSEWFGRILDAGLLAPEKLKKRVDDLKEYVKGVDFTKYMPYSDFATQLMGNHQHRTGFWEFYDRWDEYAALFDLGTKPPDPTTWLRQFEDGKMQLESFPDELKGFSFDYSPIKCIYDSGACRATYTQPGPNECSKNDVRPKNCAEPTYYRYAVNPYSKGWEMWWSWNFKDMARLGYAGTFVDNVGTQNCWNAECHEAFRKWAVKRFKTEELKLLVPGTPSLYLDSGFELSWLKENGAWRTPYATAATGLVFPDVNAYAGLYAARVEGPALFQTITTVLPAGKKDKDYVLTVHYRTQGDAKATMTIQHGAASPLIASLDAASAWTPKTVNFHVTGADVNVSFNLESSGPAKPVLWLDEILLREAGTEAAGAADLSDITLPTYEQSWNFEGRFKAWAAVKFYNETRGDRMTLLRDAAREINPNFQIFANSTHPVRGADFFNTESQGFDFERFRLDVGFNPGVYRPAKAGEAPNVLSNSNGENTVSQEILVTNVFDYKAISSMRFLDEFSYMHHMTRSPPKAYAHNADSAVLRYAEVAAFGGGAAADLGLSIFYYFYAPEERAGLREIGSKFLKFTDTHKDFYECVRSQADAALVFHDIPAIADQDKAFTIAQSLAERGILWDVFADERKIDAKALARHKVVFYHAVERLPEEEAKALIDYMNAGGIVVLSGKVGERDGYLRMRSINPTTVWPPVALSTTEAKTYAVGKGKLISVPAGLSDVGPVLKVVEEHVKRPLTVLASLNGQDLSRMRVAAWAGYKKTVLHFVNFNVPLGQGKQGQVKTLSDVEVQIPAPAGWKAGKVTLYSPESASSSGTVSFTETEDGMIRFTIPSLRIYDVAVIEE
jgi:hypothetical protein